MERSETARCGSQTSRNRMAEELVPAWFCSHRIVGTSPATRSRHGKIHFLE
ncbi:MAG: hypothetical protein ACLUSL_02385 [Ruminococcus sp.]